MDNKYKESVLIVYVISVASKTYILSITRRKENKKRWKVERLLMSGDREFTPVKITQEGFPRQFFTINDSYIKLYMP